MNEVRRTKEFDWPLHNGVLEEWVTLTFAIIRGKRVVVERVVEFVERPVGETGRRA